MPEIKFYRHDPLPMEMHKVKIVQKLNLLPVRQRLDKIKEVGFNTFLLHNSDIFMDMERGTLSEERNPDGSERIASVEMVRLAFPRRVFTLSQTEYVIDRVKWLYDHRHLIGGLRFVHEPKTLRFFTDRLEPVSDWSEKLVAAYDEYSAPVEHPRPAKLNSTVAENEQHRRSSCTLTS